MSVTPSAERAHILEITSIASRCLVERAKYIHLQLIGTLFPDLFWIVASQKALIASK